MKAEDFIPALPSSEEGIDIISFLKALWNGRKTIFILIPVFTAFGLFVAINSPNVYTASTTMVPQLQTKSGNLGGLGGLAAMAGINLGDLGSSTQDLSPMLYPEIVKSYPFQKEIIYAPLKWNSFDKPISLVDYAKIHTKPNAISLVKKYTLGLPGVVISLFYKPKEKNDALIRENDSLFQLTSSERGLCDALSKSLTLSVNTKSGYLTLSALGPEPLMTAQLVDKAQKLLQTKITEYRINKAQKNLAFIQDRYNENKKEFELAQNRLAIFRDRNLNMASNVGKTEEEKLQSEYQLAFNIYSEIAKQLESSKIRVKEDTPVFSIIQPICVPIVRTKPNKPIIMGTWLVLGAIIGMLWIFGRMYFYEFRNKWKGYEVK